MLYSPDNILRTPSSVTTKKGAGSGGFKGHFIHYRHIPFIELNPQVAFNPRERVVLTDGKNHIIGRKENRINGFRFLRVGIPFQAFKFHAHQLAFFHYKAFWRMVDKNFHALFLSVFEFPWRCFEIGARTTGHDFNIFAAKP